MEDAGGEEKKSEIKKRVGKKDLDSLAGYQEDTKIQVAPQQMGDSLTVLS